jgi:hypothetical protein
MWTRSTSSALPHSEQIVKPFNQILFRCLCRQSSPSTWPNLAKNIPLGRLRWDIFLFSSVVSQGSAFALVLCVLLTLEGHPFLNYQRLPVCVGARLFRRWKFWCIFFEDIENFFSWKPSVTRDPHFSTRCRVDRRTS